MNSKIRKKVISSILLCTICVYSTPIFAFTKDETVYSKVDGKGENYQTIVSTHLENEEELEIINDISDLLKIENTNGEEEFSKEGSSLIWKADKKDIYYQGESQKELPIECHVKYELNGKEMEPEEILGKSGHVKITIEYQNKEEHMVNINGKEEKMYTPFIVVAGTILKNDVNKNIKISNGKVINDGSKTFLMGIAMPGLEESLRIKQNDIEIPKDIEITMDASKFELGNIITFVTPKILEEKDLNFLDKLDNIYDKVNTLEQASIQIQEGSVALAEGTSQLASGTEQLKEGSNTAYNGAKQIKAEVAKAGDQLTNDKSEALDVNMLNAIGKQAKQTAILSKEQKAQIGAQAQAVATQTIEGQKVVIGQQAASQVANLKLTAEQKQNIAVNVKMALEANENYKALPAEQQGIILQFSQNSAITAAEATAVETAKQVANKTAQQVAEQVAGQVANNTAQLVAQEVATQTAETTAKTVAKQVANEVKAKAQNQVASQMSILGEGLNQLTAGLNNLKEGTSSLQSGANELDEGANTLAQGVKSFNEEGIKKICNYINGNMKDVSERIEKLQELSKEYNNFTMLNEENNGNVKFIMIMDAIKKQENNDDTKNEVLLPTEKEKEEKK